MTMTMTDDHLDGTGRTGDTHGPRHRPDRHDVGAGGGSAKADATVGRGDAGHSVAGRAKAGWSRTRRSMIRGAGAWAVASATGARAADLDARPSARALGPPVPGASSRPRSVVVVMLRGAIDGLSVVVPHADPDYARGRPDIAIAAPGEDAGALPLDAFFGLHPALAPLVPLWTSGRMAFVHASGSPDPTRSHFDAQDFMETATPGRRATADGWLNRLLQADAGLGTSAVRGVSLGPTTPRLLVGRSQVASLPTQGGGRRAADESAPTMAAALDRAWRAEPDVAPVWAAMRDSRRAILTADEGMEANVAPGAVPLAALAGDAARLGRLMRREPSLSAARFSVGGWDTHVNQGGARGTLAARLGALAGGVEALVRALDDRLDDTLVVVMSEFGRTVRQNGARGTDHGHGNAIWLIGGGVRGGRVHGHWPGLDAASLHDGRDLAITTDFRQVVAQALERHLRLDDRAIARVLPDGAGRASELDVLRG